ncbi:hypothetical protein BH18ACT8_BH18ACT8_00620 [soil metagenome]
MLSRVRGGPYQSPERGAAAIMVAISMTVLLVVAALVLDFGQVRYDKQGNKSAADSASAAGVRDLSTGDDATRPWKGICTALSYLTANSTELTGLTGSYQSGSGAPVTGNPCASGSPVQNIECSSSDQSTWARYTGTADGGRISVEIKSPYVLPDPAFSEDTALSADTGVAAQGGCDQIAVIVTESETPGFGRLVTTADITTRIRSVARTVVNPQSELPVALVLLERNNCSALTVNSVNTFINIKGNQATPGSIHADSLGNGSCTGGAKVLYGKFARHIIAHKAETGGLPGLITTAALSGLPGANPANASDGATNVCAEQGTSCSAASGRGLIGRAPVDRRYLSGVRAAMAAASTEYNHAQPPASAASAGYTVVSNGCNNISGNNNATKIFFNCPSGASFDTYTLPNATDVVINGTATIKSNQTLSLPKAQRVYIKGVAGGTGLSANGSLSLNQGTSPTCATRTTAPRARLVVGGGSFSSSAQSSFHLCHTTVLLADSTGATPCPLPTSVSTPGLAPYTNTCRGTISVGGSGVMDWTAPNLVTGQATATDWSQLEDLALWTETSADNKIGGGGFINVSGVFFLPNADPFTLAGQGTQEYGVNAQFVSRRLEAAGQGTLNMRPDPFDVITLPGTPLTSLVR